MIIKNDFISVNPFPGLRAFRPEERHLFFGRMESTTKVVTRLLENRFVAVIGASGSGKSSLVLSGVIPALMNDENKGKKTWSFIVLRPEQNPIGNLASQLSEMSSGPGFTYQSPAAVEVSLNNRTEGIIDIVNKIRKNLRQQVLIVVDQFEEIFRYSSLETRGTIGDEATDFIDLLVNAAHQPDQGLYIILTLRSEYIADCARFHSLTNLLNNGSYLLPQLNRDSLAAVIEEPIKESGATIDRSLVKIILSDIGDRPGQLPVLQHLLMRMWEQWNRSGDTTRPITVMDYDEAGRLKGAISKHAGQAFNSLDPRHRYVCSRLFRCITERMEDGKEIRRPEKISKIAELTGCSIDEVKEVVEVFRLPEYSFITPGKEAALTDESIVDLSHESIIKLWGTLRKWMEEEEAARKIYLQLATAAAAHQEGKGKLWSPPELLMALKWQKENNPTLAWAERLDPAFERTMLFLKNSESEYLKHEEHNKTSGTKKLKRSRFYAGILGLLLVLSFITIGVVWSLRAKAEKERSVALILTDKAVASNIDLSDTIKAVKKEAEESKADAISALGIAKNAEQKAEIADMNASSAAAEVKEAKTLAEEEKRLKIISVARSLAVRSLTHTDQKDLQILLAWQGYLFNRRQSGVSNDADIYAALYDVSKRYGNRYYSQFLYEKAAITAMAPHPTEGKFYAATAEGNILQWQIYHPERGSEIIWTGDKIIESMSVNDDASWLACGTSDSEIVMIPLSVNEMGYRLNSMGGKISTLMFSSDGDYLYSSSQSGRFTEWDLTNRTGRDIMIASAEIAGMDMSEDRRFLAGITTNGEIMLWRMDSGDEPVIMETGNRLFTTLAFVPWEDKLVIADHEGTVEIWDREMQHISDSFSAHDTKVTHIAFNVKEKQMVTSGENGKIKLWNMADLKQIPVTIEDNNETVINLKFFAEGNAFLAATSGSVTQRPAHVENMVSDLCSKVSRNLTLEEWYAYVGRDIDYEKSCTGTQYKIRVNEIIQTE